MITKKKLLQIKKNDLQGEFTKGEGNPQPIYILFFSRLINIHKFLPLTSEIVEMYICQSENRNFQNL